MPGVIVSPTPIILLALIGRLGLLPKLYDRVAIPDAVYDEVTAKADSASRAIVGRPITECLGVDADMHRFCTSGTLSPATDSACPPSQLSMSQAHKALVKFLEVIWDPSSLVAA